MINVKIGCDPEGFLVDGNGEFVSAHDVLPGTKHEPFKLEYGAVQVDGIAVEFNIDPVDNAEDFSRNVNHVIYQINGMIREADKSLSINWTPVARFRPDIWLKVPENNKVLGCDPDYNVHGMVNVNPTEKLQGMGLRTAAGHIHIGFRDDLIDDPMEMGHFMQCLYIAKGFHEQPPMMYRGQSREERDRLEFYGHTGSFRPKKYGVELRAPSNLWVRSEDTQKEMFNQTRERFRELVGL